MTIVNNGFKILLNRGFNATPDYKQVTQFKVGTSQSATQITDTDLDNPADITIGVTTKDLDSVSVSETNYEATRVAYLNTLEANGNNIDSIADFNEDATAKMHSVFKFSSVSKSNTDELKFYLRSRLVRR